MEVFVGRTPYDVTSSLDEEGYYTIKGEYVTDSMDIQVTADKCITVRKMENPYAIVTWGYGTDDARTLADGARIDVDRREVTLGIRGYNGAKVDTSDLATDGLNSSSAHITIDDNTGVWLVEWDALNAGHSAVTDTGDIADKSEAANLNPSDTKSAWKLEPGTTSGTWTLPASLQLKGHAYDLVVLTTRKVGVGEEMKATFTDVTEVDAADETTKDNAVDVTESGITLFAGADYAPRSKVGTGLGDGQKKIEATMSIFEANGTETRLAFDGYTGTDNTTTPAVYGSETYTAGTATYTNTTAYVGTKKWAVVDPDGNDILTAASYASQPASVPYDDGTDHNIITSGAEYDPTKTVATMAARFTRDQFPHSTVYEAGIPVEVKPLSDWYDSVSLKIESMKDGTYANGKSLITKQGVIREIDATASNTDTAFVTIVGSKKIGTNTTKKVPFLDASTVASYPSYDAFGTYYKSIATSAGVEGIVGEKAAVDWNVSGTSYGVVSGTKTDVSTGSIDPDGSAGTHAVIQTRQGGILAIQGTGAQRIKVAATVYYLDGSSGVVQDTVKVVAYDPGYFAVPTLVAGGTTYVGTGAAAITLESTGDVHNQAKVNYGVYHALTAVEGGKYITKSSSAPKYEINSADELEAMQKDTANIAEVTEGITWDGTASDVELYFEKSSKKVLDNGYSTIAKDADAGDGSYTVTATKAGGEDTAHLSAAVGDFLVVDLYPVEYSTVAQIARRQVTILTEDSTAEYQYPALKDTAKLLTTYTSEWKTNAEKKTTSSALLAGDITGFTSDAVRIGVVLSDVPVGATLTLPTLEDFESVNTATSTMIDPKKTLYGWAVTQNTTMSYYQPGGKVKITADGNQTLQINAIWAPKFSTKAGANAQSETDSLGHFDVYNGNTLGEKGILTKIRSAVEDDTDTVDVDETVPATVIAVTGENDPGIPAYVGFYALDFDTDHDNVHEDGEQIATNVTNIAASLATLTYVYAPATSPTIIRPDKPAESDLNAQASVTAKALTENAGKGLVDKTTGIVGSPIPAPGKVVTLKGQTYGKTDMGVRFTYKDTVGKDYQGKDVVAEYTEDITGMKTPDNEAGDIVWTARLGDQNADKIEIEQGARIDISGNPGSYTYFELCETVSTMKRVLLKGTGGADDYADYDGNIASYRFYVGDADGNEIVETDTVKPAIQVEDISEAGKKKGGDGADKDNYDTATGRNGVRITGLRTNKSDATLTFVWLEITDIHGRRVRAGKRVVVDTSSVSLIVNVTKDALVDSIDTANDVGAKQVPATDITELVANKKNTIQVVPSKPSTDNRVVVADSYTIEIVNLDDKKNGLFADDDTARTYAGTAMDVETVDSTAAKENGIFHITPTQMGQSYITVSVTLDSVVAGNDSPVTYTRTFRADGIGLIQVQKNASETAAITKDGVATAIDNSSKYGFLKVPFDADSAENGKYTVSGLDSYRGDWTEDSANGAMDFLGWNKTTNGKNYDGTATKADFPVASLAKATFTTDELLGTGSAVTKVYPVFQIAAIQEATPKLTTLSLSDATRDKDGIVNYAGTKAGTDTGVDFDWIGVEVKPAYTESKISITADSWKYDTDGATLIKTNDVLVDIADANGTELYTLTAGTTTDRTDENITGVDGSSYLKRGSAGDGKNGAGFANTLYLANTPASNARAWNNGMDLAITPDYTNVSNDIRVDRIGIGKLAGATGIVKIHIKADDVELSTIQVNLNGEYKPPNGKYYYMEDGKNRPSTKKSLTVDLDEEPVTHFYGDDGVRVGDGTIWGGTWTDGRDYFLVKEDGTQLLRAEAFASGESENPSSFNPAAGRFKYLYYVNTDSTLLTGELKQLPSGDTFYYNSYGEKVIHATHPDDIDEYNVYTDPVTGKSYLIDSIDETATLLGEYLLADHAWDEAWTKPVDHNKDASINMTFTYKAGNVTKVETVPGTIERGNEEDVTFEDGTKGSKIQYTATATAKYPSAADGKPETFTQAIVCFFDANGIITDREGQVETYKLQANGVTFDPWTYAGNSVEASVKVTALYDVYLDGVKSEKTYKHEKTLDGLAYDRGDETLDRITFTAVYTPLDGSEAVTATKTFVYSTGKPASTFKLVGSVSWGDWSYAPKAYTATIPVGATYSEIDDKGAAIGTKRVDAVVTATDYTMSEDGKAITFKAKYERLDKNADGTSIYEEKSQAFVFETGEIAETYALKNIAFSTPTYVAKATTAEYTVTATYSVKDYAGKDLADKTETKKITVAGTQDGKGKITFQAKYTGLDKQEHTDAKTYTYVMATGLLDKEYTYKSHEFHWADKIAEGALIPAVTIDVTYGVKENGQAVKDETDTNIAVTSVSAGDIKGNKRTYTATYVTRDQQTLTESKAYNIKTGKEATEGGESGKTESEPVEPEKVAVWNLFYTTFNGSDYMEIPLPEGADLTKVDSKAKWPTYYTIEGNQVKVKVTDPKDRKKAASASNSLITVPVFGQDESGNAVQTGEFEYQLPVSYVKPSLKLTSTSGTVNSTLSEAQLLKTTVTEKKSTGLFEALDISDQKEGTALYAPKTTASITGVELGDATGEIVIGAKDKTSGKVQVQLENWCEAVSVNYSVKAVKKNVLTTSAKQLIMNTNATEGTDQTVTLSVNGTTDYDAAGVTVTMPKKWSESGVNITSGIDESGKLTGSEITFSYNGAPKKGNYAFKFATSDRASVTFKLVVSNLSLTNKAVTLAQKAKLNLVTGQKLVLVPTLKGVTGAIEGVTISDDKNFSAAYNEELGQIIVSPAEGASLSTTNYTADINMTVGGVACKTAVKIKPVATSVSVKIAKVKLPKAQIIAGTAEGKSNVLSTYKQGGKTFSILPQAVKFTDGTANAELGDGWYTVAKANANVKYNAEDGTIEVKSIANAKGKGGSVKVELTYAGGKTVKKTLSIATVK